MRINSRLFPAALGLLLAAALPAQVTYFAATLDGSQESPANASPGRGFGIVRVDAATGAARIMVYATGLTGTATASHMHQGAVGSNGGVVIGLAGGPEIWTGTGTLTPAQQATLAAGGMYMNVHSSSFAGGEVRGQVVTATSTRLGCRMDGTGEVPANGSTATGTCIAFLHEPDNRLVYAIDTQGLTNVTAAHFHAAAAGTNGPAVVPLNGANGSYRGVTDRLTAAQVATLKSGGFYVNVHTAAFPGGEIRGQVQLSPADYRSQLSGANEVPANASTATAEASLVLDANGVASIRVNYAGFTGTVTASHIHRGAAGINGPVVVPLTLAAAGLITGSYTPSAADLADLNSGQWYVNIHSSTFPGGELRGQLAGAELPTTYGQGCPGSNGKLAEVGATGAPSLGGSFDVDLYGARTTTLAVMTLGFRRDSVGTLLPLPVELPTLGLAAPGCFLLVDPASSLVQFTDARGSATQPFRLPFAPALRGLGFYTQWLVFDAGANAAGLVLSNALQLAIR